MRRNWKRILSLLLTVAMIFTMNTSVFATEPGTIPEGDQATVEAAETTEPAAAETVEETKETNSEATSETTEESKAEETAVTEEVAAETAPAATAETAVEETAAAEETTAATKTEAVVEETEEVAPVEETVVEEAEAVVEATKDDVKEVNDGNTEITGWTLSLNGENITGNSTYVSTNTVEGTFVISFNEAAKNKTVIATPGENAERIILSSNTAINVSLNGIGTVNYIIVSGNNIKVSGNAMNGTVVRDALHVDQPFAESGFTQVNTGAGVKTELIFAQPTTAFEYLNNKFALSENGIYYKGESDLTEWKVHSEMDVNNVDKHLIAGNAGAHGEMLVSADEAVYKMTVSAPKAIEKVYVSVDKTKYNKVTVSAESVGDDFKYTVAYKADGDMEYKVASGNATEAEIKNGISVDDLKRSTDYTFAVSANGRFDEGSKIIFTNGMAVEESLKIGNPSTYYYYFGKGEKEPVSEATIEKYFADEDKPTSVKKVSENFALYVSENSGEEDPAKYVKAAVTSWNFIKNGKKGDHELSDSDIEKLVSGDEIEIIPVSGDGIKLVESAISTVSGITLVISEDKVYISLSGDSVTASANETVETVRDRLAQNLSVSFNEKPVGDPYEYDVDWFIDDKSVSDEDLKKAIENEPFSLSANKQYKVSVNVAIKKGENTLSGGSCSKNGYLDVKRYTVDAPEAPSDNMVTITQDTQDKASIKVSNNSVSQIDVIVYFDKTKYNEKTVSQNFKDLKDKDFNEAAKNLGVYKAFTIDAKKYDEAEYASGEYTFYIRYAKAEVANTNYDTEASGWTLIKPDYTVETEHDKLEIAKILAEKYEAGTDKITVSVNDGAPDGIRYILVSKNTASQNVRKLGDGDTVEYWKLADNDKVSFNGFVSGNSLMPLEAGETYWIYAAYFSTFGKIDSPVSDYKPVTTKKLGSIKSVTLKRDKDSITYEGLHSKLVSQNFTAEPKFDEDAYFDKDDVEIAIRMTLSDNTSKTVENYNKLMKAEKAPTADGKIFIDPTETSGNQVNAGKYIVRAFAEVKNDKQASYDKKSWTVSSSAVEFTIKPAEARFVVSVNETAGNVKNKQILKGKNFVFNDDADNNNITLSVYDSANKSYETLGVTGDIAYNVTGAGVNPSVLTKGNSVSFASAGIATFTLSEDKLTLKDGEDEVSGNFTLGKTNTDTVEVVNIQEVKIEATSTPLYYEAANKKDSFAKNEPGLYVKVTNGGDELTEAGYKNVEYTFMTVSDGTLSEWSNTTKKEAGQKIWVSANFALAGESKGSTGTAVVEVEKQPINVVFNGGEEDTLAGQATRGTAKSELKSEIKSVSVNVVTLKADGKTYDRDDKPMDDTLQKGTAKEKDIFKNTVSLDFSRVNTEMAGPYEVTAQDLTPADGVVSKNYIIASATGDYRINGKFSVKVVDADTGAQYGDIYELSSVSNDLAIKLDKVPNKWYLKYTLGATTAETIDTLDDALGMTPASNNSGVYTIKFKEPNRKFKLEDYKGEHLVVYVSYAEDTAPVASTGKNTPASYRVDYIKPVVYTGEKHVAMVDTKQASKKNTAADLDVVVRNGSEELIYNVDYTISYKNNVNAINESTNAKKLPQIIIKGKGAHKGVKLTVNFSILPADFATMAEVSLKKPYFKLNGKTKANSLVTVVSKETGKKLKGKFNIVLYDEEDTEKKFTDSAKITDTVSAGAVKYYQVVAKNADLKKYPNYDTNWTTYGDAEVIGIPVNSQTLKVGGTNKKIDYKEGITLNDLVGTKFKVTAKANKKIGNAKTEWTSVADAQKAGVEFRFYDKNKKALEASANGIGNITAAGTYYLGVGPKEDDILSLKAYGVYEPTFVKFTVKGTAIKSAFKLSTAKEAYDGKSKTVKIEAKKPAKVDVSIKSVSVDLFLPGSNEPIPLGYLDKINADLDGSRTDLFVMAGTYTIRLTGQGIADGVQNLKYTVTPVKATGVTAKLNNDKLSYNAAGYYKGDFEVTCGGLKLEEGVDYTVAYKVKKAAGSEGTYTINGTGTAFKGKVTGKFSVVACDLSAFEAEDTTGKTAQHNYYTGTASENNIKLYQANSTTKKELKAGVDYTISTNKVTKGSNDNFTGTLTVK